MTVAIPAGQIEKNAIDAACYGIWLFVNMNIFHHFSSILTTRTKQAKISFEVINCFSFTTLYCSWTRPPPPPPPALDPVETSDK